MINHSFVFSGVTDIPNPPEVPRILFFGQKGDGNVVDLSDPEIISFKKKNLGGGRERITIVRNTPDDKNVERLEHIIVTGKGGEEKVEVEVEVENNSDENN